MEPVEILNLLKERFGEAITDTVEDGFDPHAVVAVEKLSEIAHFLKEDEQMKFDSLMNLSGVHLLKEKRFKVVYHLYSMSLDQKITIKVDLDISENDHPEVPTVSDVWQIANWQEREAWDMYGMRFTGHPDHRRMLLPEDWVGHPLRKDYEAAKYYHGIEINPKR